MAFSRAALEEASVCRSPLGFSGQDVTSFWNHYRDLPQGIYITEVDPHADAAKQGSAPGDILLSIDDTAITSSDSLKTLLYNYTPGDEITAVIYRSGQQYAVKLTVEEAKGP